MADNVTFESGANSTPAASTVVATDDIGGAHYQIMKLALGADGSASLIGLGQQAMANSMPVVVASNQSAIPISGSVSASGTFPVTQSGTWDIGSISNALPAGDNNIGNFDVQTDATTGFSTAALSSIGASAVQLTASTLTATRGVLVKAANANSGAVYVGSGSALTAGSADATDGFELGAGESLLVKITSPSAVWLVGSASGQKVFWATV